MAMAADIEPTRDAVADFLRREVDGAIDIAVDRISVERYGTTDVRTGWDTHAVMLKGTGILAWTDGPLRGVERTLPDGYYWCSHEVICWIEPGEEYQEVWSVVQINGGTIHGPGSDVSFPLADIPAYVEFRGPLMPPV